MPKSPIAVYNGEQLTRFTSKSFQGEIATSDTNDVAIIAQTSTKYQLVIRKIVVNVYTTAAVAITFQGDGAGGDPVYSIAASPGVGPRTMDWGNLGYALPLGEGLEVALGAGGNGFTFVVEAYLLPAATMTPAQMVN